MSIVIMIVLSILSLIFSAIMATCIEKLIRSHIKPFINLKYNTIKDIVCISVMVAIIHFGDKMSLGYPIEIMIYGVFYGVFSGITNIGE